MEAADQFHHKTKGIHELWQTDFTYMKIIGWGWYYLSSILDEYSRYIVAWKLTKSMSAVDVKDTLDLAIQKSGIDNVKVRHRPRLLSDNGPCYLARDLQDYLAEKNDPYPWKAVSPNDSRQDRTLSSDNEKCH